jgi:hypothetical protein
VGATAPEGQSAKKELGFLKKGARWRPALSELAQSELSLFGSSAPVYSRQEGNSGSMPRPRYRACLESGLKLDLNQILRGARPPERIILSASYRWTNNCTGEGPARATITAHLAGAREASFRIQLEDLDRTIILVSVKG